MKALLFSLSFLALAACMEQPARYCYEGVTYIASSESYRAGITLAVDREGKPIPC